MECGGTLINRRWIISAGHCLYLHKSNPSIITVKLGDFFRNEIDPYEQTFEVESMEFGGNSTQGYSYHTSDNDLVLIKLSRNVNYNKYVRPICLLEEKHRNPSLTSPGKLATIVGWGYYRESQKFPANSPMEATIHILDTSECKGQFGSTRLTSDMLCAKGNLSDACPGDSGGPMMCQSDVDNRFTLCGIISFGKLPTCQEGSYGAYTKVFSYVNAIKTKINN